MRAGASRLLAAWLCTTLEPRMVFTYLSGWKNLEKKVFCDMKIALSLNISICVFIYAYHIDVHLLGHRLSFSILCTISVTLRQRNRWLL